MKAKFKRRTFIKSGIASGVSLAAFGKYAFSTEANVKPFILVIQASGGWDQSLVFDFKPSTTGLYLDPNQTQVNANGLQYVSNSTLRPNVDLFFNTHASKCTIINGVFCHELDHQSALQKTSSAFNLRNNKRINYLSYYAANVGTGNALSHLAIDVPVESDTASIYTFEMTLDAIENHYPNYLSGYSNSNTRGKISNYLSEAFTNFSINRINDTYDGRKVDSITSKFLSNDATANIVNTNFDGTQLTKLRKRAFFALKMFEKGYTKAATVLDEDKLSWDTHTDFNDFALTTQSNRFNQLFDDLNAIIQQAESLGISDKLMIIVKSEMGRDSRVSSKNHWPYTSCLIWSNDLNGSKTVGKTDEFLRGEKLDQVLGIKNGDYVTEVTFNSIFAALFQKNGLDKNQLWKRELLPSFFIL